MVDFKQLREKRSRLREILPTDLNERNMQILSCISYTEPTGFGELCGNLRQLDLCPEKGDKIGWSEIFNDLNYLNQQGYLSVEKIGGKIEELQITDKAADLIKGLKDQDRGLLRMLE